MAYKRIITLIIQHIDYLPFQLIYNTPTVVLNSFRMPAFQDMVMYQQLCFTTIDIM